ncbi:MULTISPECIES: ATP-dependent helicase HrpB [Providencia]|uniref:ATP-dependent helicase HrpB n=2 Tax=Providencia huaxiensis TaxID=2027290 RepID=A0ABU2IUL4_9GAMM|nr:MULTISPECIES: ATP-dependent helicase HrpB [Providencia]MBZ3682545.1 ATP-dependent helicase HrpB [Providencia rettgeri]AXH64378.1 ATP-dependent helicase HrpB [Providencia huaxiensis]MDT0132763.1 ATP-dependent helicase HrpB [Providencia huaxiensis]MDT1979169.1 ATP-dependent helicase HrpB [Providencia huaxiensis]QLR02262.1 ATP-dependent helicase HrpB [Providencia rettgeri]
MLPIFEVCEDILTALMASPQVLLHAPTGAGKSTVLPLEILKSGVINGRVIMLEPRRLAARSVAARLAQQLGEEVGHTIGLRMRSETKVSRHTRLEVVTEGVLTRLLQNDPMLEGVGLVILDEFHERNLQADLGLALLIDSQQALREDLRILLMSATLDNQGLSQLFPDAPVITSQGRTFPVIREYHPINPNKLFHKEVALAAWQLLQQEHGSLLLFLPGMGEIEKVRAELASMVSEDILLCPLYGALTLQAQQQAIQLAPEGMRKVVLATNIAETSLTIEGIRLVMDSGFERVGQFNPRTGLTKLIKQRISQASMAQRAGRAGRLETGVCWHLLSEEQAERAAQFSEAEIAQSDLSSLWLSLLQWGCHDAAQLNWLTLPPKPAISAAKNLLGKLGAIDAAGKLTPFGQQMAELGSSVRTAAMLCKAQQSQNQHVIQLAALLVAIIEEPPRQQDADLRYCIERPTEGWCKRASALCEQKVPSTIGQRDALISEWLPTLLATGFPDYIAKSRDNQQRYQLASGLGATLGESDRLMGTPWLIVVSLWQPENTADARISLAYPVEIERLQADCPSLFNKQETVEWDEQKGTLLAWKRLQCGQLVVKSERLSNPDKTEVRQALVYWLKQNGLQQLNWQEDALQLCVRCTLAKQYFPDVDLPDFDDTALLDSLGEWLEPYLDGITNKQKLQQIDLASLLINRLDWQQQQWLESMFPKTYRAPSLHDVSIYYALDKPPVVAIRMQEMYGEKTNPTIAQGKIAVTISLLSPAMRPLQITQDLGAFWQGSYKEIQKEMKGRYPKHLWPDDPANTAPTRQTKKAMMGAK